MLCSGDALDIDGDEVTLEYAWYTGATEDSLSLSNVTTSTYTVGASDTWIRCEITPNDGSIVGETVSSDTLERTSPCLL